MNKTPIEWCDYTINPVKGLCPVDCKDNQGKSYCYARRMYKRFKWNPEIRYIEPGFTIAELQTIKKPSRIFWGSTFELFQNNVPELLLKDTFKIVRQFPQHTHIFLTKQPQNLMKWSPFPSNCWVLTSTPNAVDAINAKKYMTTIQAKVKGLSIEPMFYWNLFPDTLSGILYGYDWLILGSQTQPVKHPSKAQVLDILATADGLHIPVFIKEPLASYMGIQRQEFPKE